ncbi:MAG: thiamine pyrophosphate-dependent enzyme [Thermoanaerobaculia bacterium]|nr:thiamine pyrophosphate-dependent enzyme [Thermoanaerobaculia bacterium]
MTSPEKPAAPTLAQRYSAFIAERFPFALPVAREAFLQTLDGFGRDPGRDSEAIELMIDPLTSRIRNALDRTLGTGEALARAHATPTVPVGERLRIAVDRIIGESADFLVRESIAASLSDLERREILRGMILTRAVDNRLKAFFSSGEVKFGNAGFQGKGFRSLGQEAIYAASIRFRRGADYRRGDGWTGDVVAPLIRDLGAALAMKPDGDTVRMVLSAQMGKAGPPMNGRDFHIGDLEWGILPASAPLAISSLTIAGLAMAFEREKSGRVAVSFIGEGGSSLGEWHEAINLCAARKLPAVFCVENNQTALSTPVSEQSAVRVFADKAEGYGIPGVTIDGTDPEAIAAAFTWAADRARRGLGPALIELVCMRMCGHAHHDDMLYLGREPQLSWEYPELTEQGYADPGAWEYWSGLDPIPRYAAVLASAGVIEEGDLDRFRNEAERLVEEEAKRIVQADWPDPERVGAGVLAGEEPRRHIEILDSLDEVAEPEPPLEVEEAPSFDPKGQTFLEAVMLGVRDALAGDDRVFVYGEDVGGEYGNAFLLLRPLLEDYGDRIVNSPLAEGGVLGVCIGAALGGQRPIGEIQFNDFVATGFNQLVNSAAKIRYRWEGEVPMVVRMPWGGLRSAGPYHSQNTEPWFYRTPGLKIVTPSTPHDARAMLASAVADPDPVLYYEHIALYRDPKIRQNLGTAPPDPISIGRAALRRAGDDLLIISYGAYVHRSMAVADTLASEGVEAAVLDLRTISPLDRDSILRMTRHCNRVLIVHEDSRTGGIGESVAAIIQEAAFDWLDAPIRILGALDTPVPYSPPLEREFLVSNDQILSATRKLMQY